MTAFTIQWAFQKSVKIERSEEASGNADCVRSAAFMGCPFASPRVSSDQDGAPLWDLQRVSLAAPFDAPPRPRGCAEISSRPPSAEDDVRANVSKLGRRTRSPRA